MLIFYDLLKFDYFAIFRGRLNFMVLRMCMNQNTYFGLACYDASPFNLVHCL